MHTTRERAHTHTRRREQGKNSSGTEVKREEKNRSKVEAEEERSANALGGEGEGMSGCFETEGRRGGSRPQASPPSPYSRPPAPRTQIQTDTHTHTATHRGKTRVARLHCVRVDVCNRGNRGNARVRLPVRVWAARCLVCGAREGARIVVKEAQEARHEETKQIDARIREAECLTRRRKGKEARGKAEEKEGGRATWPPRRFLRREVELSRARNRDGGRGTARGAGGRRAAEGPT